VQTVIPLPENAAIKITIAHYYTLKATSSKETA